MPLQEAIQLKKVIVHETKEVNELAIENISSDVDVFVQGGDVVKGGQQDRVFTTDLILPPKSGRTPVATFCVEQGRWTKRGSEAVTIFAASTEMIAHKDLKRAVKSGKDQTAVWAEVAAAPPPPPASSTSYQLNIESKAVVDSTSTYTRQLQPAPEKQPDAVGFVYAVNGKFSGGEVYANPALFRAMWPKAIKAAAIEASTEPLSPKAPVFTVADANQSLTAPKLEAKTDTPNKRTRTAKGASSNIMLFESRDTAVREVQGNSSNAWLHRSYVAK